MPGPMDLVNPGFKTDYVASGPIAGVMAAQQMQDWQDSQGRAFRDSDLSYQSAENKYQNDLLDNPLKAADRLQKTNEANLQNSLYADQTKDTQARSDAAAKIEKALADKTDAQLKQIDDRNKMIYASSEGIEDEQQSPGAVARNAEKYKTEILPQLKMAGIAKGAPDEWGPQAQQWLASHRQAAIMTAPQVAKERDLRIQGESAANVANITQKGHVEAAQITADAMKNRLDTQGDPTKTMINTILNKPVLDQIDVERLHGIFVDKYLSDLSPYTKLADAEYDRYQVKSASERAAIAKQAGVDEGKMKEFFLQQIVDKKEAEFKKSIVGDKPIRMNSGAMGQLQPDGKIKQVSAGSQDPQSPSMAGPQVQPNLGQSGPSSGPPGAPAGGRLLPNGTYQAPDGSVWGKKKV